MICPNSHRKILSASHDLVAPHQSQSEKLKPRILRSSLNSILCIIVFFATTATAQVISVSLPEQTVQDVNVGANVVFTVDAVSQSGAVEYHWQYSKGGATFANLRDGDFNGRVSGTSTANLQISNAQTDDSARFRCLVTDPAMGPGGPAANSGPGFLTVSTGLPFQITHPSGPSGLVPQGGNATFAVEITGQAGTLGGVWQFLSDATGGTFVSLQDGLQSSQSTISGSTQTVLRIDNAQPNDSGRYRYVVGDTVGTSTSDHNSGPVHLTVTPSAFPGFAIAPLSPTSGSVLQGDSVTTVITVNPVNGFSGSINLTAAAPSGITPTFVPSSLTLPGANTSTLTLTADSAANTGTATILVTATDGSGSTKNEPFNMTVNLSPTNSVPAAPVIQQSPADTIVVSASSGVVESAVFKLQATGSGTLTYQWFHLGNMLPKDSSQCTNAQKGLPITPPAGQSLTCGANGPTLVIYNPQSADAGSYICTVSNGTASSTTTHPVQLTLMTRADEDMDEGSDLDTGRPEPELQELFILIENQSRNHKLPPVATDWQSMLTWDPINAPYGNGDNKSVIGAVVGLFYGPQLIVQNKYIPGPKLVDYRCWVQSYLMQQIGAGTENPASRYFQGAEFGSFDYTGWVDTAITAVAYWAQLPQSATELQSVPPAGCTVNLANLTMYAQTYLKSAVGIYALTAASGPQTEFVGVTGQHYQIPNQRKPASNTPILNTNPQQYMSPKFSVDRTSTVLGPLYSPAIALAGQRTEPGFWPGGDLRAPILCLALLGLQPKGPKNPTTCDTTGLQQGQYSLLEGNWQHLVSSGFTVSEEGNGPIAGVLETLLSSSDSTSLLGFINGTSTDLSAIKNLTNGVKVKTSIELLGWNNGVRASCMDWGNENNDRGVAIGAVYWPNGHFLSKGSEFDFLYWVNDRGLKVLDDGFKTCKFNTSVDPYELDTYQPDGTTIGAKIFLPPKSQLVFDLALGHGVAGGLQLPSGGTAAATASPAGGVYNSGQSVTLSSATPGATIYYTTDGSMPDSSSSVYTAPITFNTAGTLDTIASAPGLDDSAQLSTTYFLKTASPAFNPAGGTYTSTQSVALSDATPGATIYYTTDGSTPTTSSSVYSGPLTVATGTTINAMATAPGFYDSGVASATYTIPDFALSILSASQSAVTCGSSSYTVGLSRINGFGGNVALSVSGLPAGATATFSPASISGLATSTLTVSSASSTPTGSYALAISGTSGSLSHAVSVTLVVPDFSLAATPTSQTVTAGLNGNYTLSISAINGFNGSSNLSLSGIPTGVSASFSPTSTNGAGSSTLTVTTSAATPVGTYTLTLTATSGCRTKTTAVTLVVNPAGAPAPSISSLSPTAGGVGTVVTVNGANFGATQSSSSTVTFNGFAAKPTAWGASSITMPLPLGATTGNVVINVGGQASNGVNFTLQEDALHIFAVNCANCGAVTDVTIQNSPLNGYTIQSGDILYFYQKQSTRSVAGITLCFPGGDTNSCDDDGRTVDQNGQPIYADTTQGVHFRKVDLTPSVGLTINQVTLNSTSQTPSGRWDVYYSDIQIVSTNGTVRPALPSGTAPSFYISSTTGVTQQGATLEHAHVW